MLRLVESSLRLGLSSLRFTWIMTGPGLKRGAHVERNVWLTDVCATICHLADVPRVSEMIHDFLAVVHSHLFDLQLIYMVLYRFFPVKRRHFPESLYYRREYSPHLFYVCFRVVLAQAENQRPLGGCMVDTHREHDVADLQAS